MEERLTIGAFARRTGLTAKALRHYDALDLLRPADVDGATGYRYYEVGQIEIGRTIRHLRDLDLPLEEIRAVLDDPAGATKRLAAYRRDVEADVFRRQRILHRLNRLIEGGEPVTQDERTTPGGLTPEEERQLAVDLFNHVWELLESTGRTQEQDDRMLHAAHASRFHWERTGGPVQLATGEWQCSRVYAVLGRGEPSIFHAERALSICEGAGVVGFFRAASYEALARAYAIAGRRDEAEATAAKAREAAESIDDEEDRQMFEQDMATLPI